MNTQLNLVNSQLAIANIPTSKPGKRNYKSVQLKYKQRMFSWNNTYDVREKGKPHFKLGANLSFTHKFSLYDADRNYLGYIEEKMIAFTSTYVIKLNPGQANEETYELKRIFTLPQKYVVSNGWIIEGNFLDVNYKIKDRKGNSIAHVHRNPISFTTTYVIDTTENYENLVMLLVSGIDITNSKDTICKF